MAKLQILTCYGPLRFGSKGMNGGRDLPIVKVRDGKVVPLFPEAIKAGTLVPMPAQ